MKKYPNKEELMDAVEKSLSKISGFDFLIFYLKMEKNFTLKEIADKFGMSHENIRLYLKKIYDVIRTLYHDENISQ